MRQKQCRILTNVTYDVRRVIKWEGIADRRIVYVATRGPIFKKILGHKLRKNLG